MAVKYELTCHPSVLSAEVSAAVTSIVIRAARVSTHELQLQYCLTGRLADLRIPMVSASRREDELWRHTCAELFVAEPNQEAYCEFNFSPSTQWAAYEFSRYRQGMKPAACSAPSIAVTQTEQALTLNVVVQLPVSLARSPVLQASITMVVERSDGTHSYWAVNHATDTPDFHHRQSFVLTI